MPALAQLDPLLQHRSRLGALVLLSGIESLAFSRLKVLLDETDGNLGAQLRKLEDARYVTATKEFVNRKPTTWYSLTPTGRIAISRHLKAIESLLKFTAG
jgi:DNA-binding transcriptional ArsR family regulator